MRTTAAWTLERILETRAPAEGFLDAALPRLDPRDRPLLRELVLGTLRWLRRIDHVLVTAAGRPLDKIEPALRAPLRLAVYQLLFLDRVPPHAAVHEAVEEARRRTHRGGAGFANAVLRRVARSPRLADWPVGEADPVRRLAIETSHPDFLVARWLDRFGRDATLDLLAADNRPRPLALLAFRDRGGREAAAEELIDAGVEVEPSRLAPQGLVVRSGDPFATESFRRGDLYVQDEASQASALLPRPEPRERILDVAAAPGGKSFALVSCEPGVELVAADLSFGRLAVLRENLERLGRSLPLVVSDAARPGLAGRFDRVVVDLPCSGTGTLRKHPELKWRLSPEEVGRLADQGLALLAGAAPRVAPGGLLVAITCSLEAEENEAVVERFLETPEGRDGFSPLPLADRLPPLLAASVVGEGFWRTMSGGDHDGFTVSVLTRRGKRERSGSGGGDRGRSPETPC